MRYYFRDNRPSPMTRLLLSGVVLVALVSAIGGVYYSKGAPFAGNPFAGFGDDAKDSAADEENLQPIFIPIRKKFPPDPFPGGGKASTEKATPPGASAAVKADTDEQKALRPGSKPAASSASARLEQTANSASQPAKDTVGGKTDGPAAQNNTAGLASRGDSNGIPAGGARFDMPSGVASGSHDGTRQIRARSLASVKQESLSPAPQPSRLEKTIPSEPAKPAVLAKPVSKTGPKAAKAASLARPKPVKQPAKSSSKREVAVIRPKPARSAIRRKAPVELAVQAGSADNETVSRSAQPKYKNLDTVVEISDSGDTVAGKRWKDVSNASE